LEEKPFQFTHRTTDAIFSALARMFYFTCAFREFVNRSLGYSHCFLMAWLTEVSISPTKIDSDIATKFTLPFDIVIAMFARLTITLHPNP
jgi:hypothetical protein